MQLANSGTISPIVNTSLLQSDFFDTTQMLERKNHSASLHPFVDFEGKFSSGNFSFPTQKFTLRQNSKFVYIENFPTNSFPKIEIVLEEKNSRYNVKDFKVQPFDNSVEGEIFYTRFFLIINEAKKCSLYINEIDKTPFNFVFADLPSEVKKQVIFSAKLFRKLKFIEEFFKIQFNLPKEILAQEIVQVEILFRGITEGEFSNPTGNSITIFNYKVTKEDLESLLGFKRKSFSFEFYEDLLVLGKFFSVGKIIFETKKASIANPILLRNKIEGDIIPSLRLNIFDHQINHRFEKYLNKERLLKNKGKLEQFKNSLRQKEPEFLVCLIDAPLAEVTKKSATEIIEGLFQYHNFPDRFSLLEPKFDRYQWQIPIVLTYAQQEPILLATAYIDAKTGKVEMNVSFDELLEKGKKKAKEIFSIA